MLLLRLVLRESVGDWGGGVEWWGGPPLTGQGEGERRECVVEEAV